MLVFLNLEGLLVGCYLAYDPCSWLRLGQYFVDFALCCNLKICVLLSCPGAPMDLGSQVVELDVLVLLGWLIGDVHALIVQTGILNLLLR